MNNSCIICIELFNKLSRKKITCPYCTVEICVHCVRIYLIEYSPNSFPSCPGCTKEWTLDFISINTPNIFHNVIYRSHRAKIVIDREKSVLHNRQSLVLQEIKRRETLKKEK